MPIREDIAYSFCFTGAETEIDKIKEEGEIDGEKNINHRGLRQIGTDWHIPDPPTFWLPTTFKWGVTGASLQDYTEGEKLFSDPRHLQGISGINIVQV